jgi:hypothetical protein
MNWRALRAGTPINSAAISYRASLVTVECSTPSPTWRDGLGSCPMGYIAVLRCTRHCCGRTTPVYLHEGFVRHLEAWVAAGGPRTTDGASKPAPGKAQNCSLGARRSVVSWRLRGRFIELAYRFAPVPGHGIPWPASLAEP